MIDRAFCCFGVLCAALSIAMHIGIFRQTGNWWCLAAILLWLGIGANSLRLWR